MEGPVSSFPTREGDTSVVDFIRGEGEDKIGEIIARHRRDALYDDPQCAGFLENCDCFMDDHPKSKQGPDDAEKKACEKLLTTDCKLPSGTVFESDSFKYICQAVKEKSEPSMMHLLGDLIVPQADIAIRRMNGFGSDQLKDSMCEAWKRSIPLDDQSARLPYRNAQRLPSMGFTLPLPQPDHTVGFSSSVLVEDQEEKLIRYLSRMDDEDQVPRDERSHVSVLKNMWFPFLTAEVKCQALDMKKAERQNAHNMAVSMRGIVELFRRVDPQKPKELDRQVLGFSISQNREKVHIHAHYPVVDGSTDPNNDEQLLVTYHAYRIRNIKWTNDATKWRPYKFVMAVYKDWMPGHLKRLQSAIDALTDASEIERIIPRPPGGWGTDTSPVDDPEVPDVDFEMLKERQDDHQRDLLDKGLSKTPSGSDVP